MKKLTSFLIIMIMIFTFEVPIFAVNNTVTGTITINNVVEGQTYKIYKILDLESYNTTSKAYSYKVNSVWKDFFNTNDAKQYVTVDASTGYATWTFNNTTDTDIANFAKLALKWANDNNISPVQTSNKVVAGQNMIQFTDLELGYYLIDSTLGALCGLNTTNPTACVNEKNGTPCIDKQVQEDSTGYWGDDNTADIGQTVYFCTTINVNSGAENYILHDIMSSGLDFDKITKIEYIISENNKSDLVVGTDYNVITNSSDNCSFEVQFTDDFCNKLNTNDKIIVYYEATLNENAVIAGNGNTNETYLEYGEKNRTTSDITTTYTYKIDLIKTDGSNKLIDGAKFKIYDAETGGNEIAVVKIRDGEYRKAKEGETGVEIEVTNGKATISGLDNDTYYLEETKAPNGYNILNTRQQFIINDSNLDATFRCNKYVPNSGVQVINKAGTIFPETGGMGTVIFVGIGTTLMIGTGILLVSRKRMSKIIDKLD